MVAMHIASIGECTVDCYLDLQREFVGGISLNFAVQARRCGAEAVSLLSRIGSDHNAVILKKLADEGVDVSHLLVKHGVTARQDIALAPGGERIFPPGGYHPGVLEGYQLDEADLQFVQRHNVVVSALFKQDEAVFRQVIKSLPFQGWRVADFLDLGDYDKDVALLEHFHDRLNIAFVSGDDEMVERLRPLSKSTRCLIVVTLGAKGSVALVKGEPQHQQAPIVTNIIDTTGCGDAFQAAFTVSYWRDADVRRALQAGSKQAAQVLQHYGATV